MTLYKEIYFNVWNTIDDNSIVDVVVTEGVISSTDNLTEKIFEAFKRIIQWIEDTIHAIIVKFTTFSIRNKAFIKGFEEHKSNYKISKQNILFMSFEYNIEELKQYSGTINRLSQELENTFDNNVNNPLDYSTEEFDKWICSAFKEDATNLTDLYSKIKDGFKGKKSERNIFSSELPKYIKVIYSYDKLKESIRNDEKQSQNFVKKMRRAMQHKVSMFNSNRARGDEANLIFKRLTNLNRFVKFRVSVLCLISVLLMEYNQYSIAIVKKFYDM